jgi:hypothetical protein
VFGLFAGAAVFVYILGGIVLALRLGFDNLPPEAVVGQLPREFLITQGLSIVVLPAAAIAALYGIYRLIRREPRQPKLKRLEISVRNSKWWTLGFWKDLAEGILDGWKVLASAALASVVLVAPALGHELIKQFEWRNGLLWFLLAFLLTYVSTIAVFQIRALLVGRNFRWADDRNSWNNERVVGAMAALYAAAIVPGAIAFGATIPFLDAKVCRTTGYENGSLLGETSDKVYLGLGEPTQSDREIAVIPYSQVRQVLAGGNAHDAMCPPAEPKDSSGKPSSATTGLTGHMGPAHPSVQGPGADQAPADQSTSRHQRRRPLRTSTNVRAGKFSYQLTSTEHLAVESVEH